MVYIPKPNEKFKHLSFMLIFSGIAVWIFTSVVTVYRFAAQIAAVTVIAVGLQIMIRYVMTGFRYIVADDENGNSKFVILKIQSGKSIKVCDVPFVNAVAVFRPEEVPNYIEKYGDIFSRFNYCQNPGRKLAYSLLFYDGDNLIEVRFEPDKNFIRELLRRMPSGDNFRV